MSGTFGRQFFDTAYYLGNNKDVLGAIATGAFKGDAWDHFQQYGRFENRVPNGNFDAAKYLTANPDVLAAVNAKQVASAWDHFVTNGVVEGRAPGTFSGTFNETAYLAANLDVSGAVGSGKAFASGYQHYLLYGQAEGRAATNVAGQPINNANQAFTLTASAPSIEEGSAGDKAMTFTLTLDRVPSEAVTVNYKTVAETGAGKATAGDDYVAAASTVTFAAGQQTATVSVIVKGDTAFEAAETFKLEFSGAKLAKAVEATGTITNDDVDTTSRLTSGTNNYVGTAADNAIDGSREVLSGLVLNTLNNADRIDGGGGTDTLSVQMQENLDITPASLLNVEILSVENLSGAGRTLNLVNGDATLTTVASANNGAALTVSNIQSAVSTYDLSSTANNFTATVANARLAGTTDVATLKLSNVTAGTIDLATVSAASGYETISVQSNGSIANGSTARLVLNDGAGTSLATVNVTGSAALTIGLTPDTVTTVNAASLTGALDVLFATNTQNVNVTGGTANDIIDVNGYTANDTINGGNGTADRLVLLNAEAIAATVVQANVSNIEVIRLSNGLSGTVSVSNFGATGLRFGADMAGVGVVGFAAGTASLDLQTFDNDNGLGINSLTVNIAGVATNDVLGITMGSTTAGNTFQNAAVTINGAETVNLLSQGGANSFAGTFTITDTAATQALVITGTQNITFTGAVRADSVNASGMTGAGTLTLTGGTGTTATAITGTANNDSLVGSTAGDIISGGGGADTIVNMVTGTAAAAGDVLTGGAGTDTFVVRGSLASEAVATAYAKAANVTDFTVGASAADTDVLTLTATIGDYGASTLRVTAATTEIQSVAQNAAAAAFVTNADLIKLTTGVATTGLTVQQAFDAALGTATVTGLTAADDVFIGFFDTTNNRMVIGMVDVGANTTLEATDVVRLVGTVDMTAANYATFSATHFDII